MDCNRDIDAAAEGFIAIDVALRNRALKQRNFGMLLQLLQNRRCCGCVQQHVIPVHVDAVVVWRGS